MPKVKILIQHLCIAMLSWLRSRPQAFSCMVDEPCTAAKVAAE
jgi:hypothetical protein